MRKTSYHIIQSNKSTSWTCYETKQNLPTVHHTLSVRKNADEANSLNQSDSISTGLHQGFFLSRLFI